MTRHGTEIPLDYRLHVLDGRWRIYDVVVQGVSFIASYRSQFDRVIRAESYSSLRERLQKKATETRASRPALTIARRRPSAAVYATPRRRPATAGGAQWRTRSSSSRRPKGWRFSP